MTGVHGIDAEVVVHVADDRKQEALETYFEDLGPEVCALLEHIAMDMWAPYIAATRAQVPNAGAKIVFERDDSGAITGLVLNQAGNQTNATKK